jgi:hypothetical protein
VPSLRFLWIGSRPFLLVPAELLALCITIVSYLLYLHLLSTERFHWLMRASLFRCGIVCFASCRPVVWHLLARTNYFSLLPKPARSHLTLSLIVWLYQWESLVPYLLVLISRLLVNKITILVHQDVTFQVLRLFYLLQICAERAYNIAYHSYI